MTPQALQAFLVRLHYDPALVARVYAGEPVEGLEEAERAWIRRVDRRAWGVDPYRRARSLTALVEEYPASVAEAGMSGLDAFFGSAAFLRVLTERGSMADAFGEWIRPRAGAVADLERGLVRARRAEVLPPEPGRVRVAPGVVSLELPVGTLARWEGVRTALGPDPAAALAAGFRPRPRPRAGSGVEHVLLQVGPAGETVGEGSDGVHALLSVAARGSTVTALEQVAVRLGLEPAEAAEVVAELIADGLIVGG